VFHLFFKHCIPLIFLRITAAGGTGVLAVQLAKLAGCHVIGTCSSKSKVQLLKSIGCDRVVNYKEESLDNVLKDEYKKGVNVVYESVGGEMFDICVKHLAVKGRLIVIGFISGYQDGSGWKQSSDGSTNKSKLNLRAPLPAQILGKSASIRGFFLNNYSALFSQHFSTLLSLFDQDMLKLIVDEFKGAGIEQIVNAVEYMYSGKNEGKLVVRINKDSVQHHSKL
jgi:hypothetical protein